MGEGAWDRKKRGVGLRWQGLGVLGGRNGDRGGGDGMIVMIEMKCFLCESVPKIWHPRYCTMVTNLFPPFSE